ncbi:MAG: hypothetical protein EZS28_011246 [Streblomastix strix]|uniref:Uncharacterized protein n=1 Tax=Streblomastix strix TaxID=222440 RepID=A0A5J4WFU1_9EUKA|nr:MAG: hypothetical protein EZS28_011246 [Streblomastix strix]
MITRSLTAAEALTCGTLATIGSIFNGCQWLDLEKQLKLLLTPVPVSFWSLFATAGSVFNIHQWSSHEYVVDVPLVPIPVSLFSLPVSIDSQGVESLVGVNQSGTIQSVSYQLVSYIRINKSSALQAQSLLGTLIKANVSSLIVKLLLK